MYRIASLLFIAIICVSFQNISAADYPLNVEGVPVQKGSTIGSGADISADYVQQARKFRNDGRYELARQAYAQAISTCRNNANLEIIKREMAGIELLIRTMR